MKLNWDSQVVGSSAVLIPYHRGLVERYHAWMKDEWLRDMTASEELSLEEEYKMQDEWRVDDKKCTFIVFDRTADAESAGEVGLMAGDVNLFFIDSEDPKCAEIMVMVAEPRCRRKGLGKQAVLLMMQYGVVHLGVTSFVAKISTNNAPSIALFEKLGYVETERIEAFEEVHFRWDVTDHALATLRDKQPEFSVVPYTHTAAEADTGTETGATEGSAGAGAGSA